MLNDNAIAVIGGGLAGSECALQLAAAGFQVRLYEMRPTQYSPAHKTDHLAELVCSNSFGSQAETSAPGQLKWEAQQCGSFILAAAQMAAVPAGQALALDREIFARTITTWIESNPRIEVRHERIDDLAQIPRPAVIATGPLTADSLALSLQEHFGREFLYFFDAIAPIVDAESIDMNIVWRADRYDKGTPDYLNCPLEKPDYLNLIEAISQAEKITPKEFDQTDFFEGCMPIEAILERGPQTLRFGPMKPVGLTDPRTQRRPYAVVQLRAENREQTAFNLVGFQTRMTYSEQKRVFRMIPGLQNAEFLKLGSMHRNLFVNSPTSLNQNLSSRKDPGLFFAGQITGVEGYFESACIGLLVAHFIAAEHRGLPFSPPPRESALGALWHTITDLDRAGNFQPTNINFGLFPPLPTTIKDKTLRKAALIERARQAFGSWFVKYDHSVGTTCHGDSHKFIPSLHETSAPTISKE